MDSHEPAIRTVSTTCPYCGVGCGMALRARGDRVIGVEPALGHPVSRGQLCAKGHSSAFAVDPRDRILTPLVRAAGGFEETSWDEAFTIIVEALRSARQQAGPDSVGVIACARATNEDNYAAQKFARAVLGTNNIDHCARICHSPSVAGLRQTLGSGAMTNSIDDIDEADLIVVFGCDPTENHSIIGGRIMRAKLAGAGLLVVDPRKTRLARMADLHLQLRLGSNIALINGLLHIIFDNGWEDAAFLEARVTDTDVVRRKVKEYPPDKVAELTGVSTADLVAAARMYTEAGSALLAYGMGVTQYACGTNNVIALSNLVLAAGHVGREGTGINPLRGQNNVQGACDMGALPNVYPGYQDVSDSDARAKFSRAWGAPLSDRPGLTSLGMMKGALAGGFRALILMGEDPVVTDPDQNHVAAALNAMDLLVVCELTMTETAKHADVVLPAASFAEKDGTFTNTERRVQRVRAAIPPPGRTRGDWQMLGELAERLGDYRGLRWPNSRAVFQEMTSLTPPYSAMSYERLKGPGGLQWPCAAERPEGTPVLHRDEFPLGKARMLPVRHAEPSEQPDDDYPLWLTTMRLGYHYGCGSMTRKSPLLERETPRGVLFINPSDAHSNGINEGGPVRVRSRRGCIETCAVVTDDLPEGTVSMPYHFKEAPSNQLTNTAEDPVTKMPELKACAVIVEPLAPGTQPRAVDELHAAGELYVGGQRAGTYEPQAVVAATTDDEPEDDAGS